MDEIRTEAWEEKCWGKVLHIFHSTDVALSILEVKAGFRCSRHKHVHRSNSFLLLSGDVGLWTWSSEKLVKGWPHEPCQKRSLMIGEMIRVPAGIPHMFVVNQDGVLVEFYRRCTGPVDIQDIVRYDEGGLKDGR